MRKLIFQVALFFGAVVTALSCYNESPPVPSLFKPEDVSFNTHVLPILTTQCASEANECHNNKELPDLRDSTAYRSLTAGGYYNVTFPEESKLYKAIVFGVAGLDMPPTGQLTQLDKDLILTWITKGAPND